jgi:drug/metabolite transporter (DMT)-like permease
MNWFSYAIVTAIALALADFCVKLASGKLSNSLAILIYGSCTFLFGLSWVLWQRTQNVPQFAQTSGVLAALGVGIAFSGVTLGLYASFGAGGPISLVSPLIRLGGLLFASIAGIVIFHEPLTWRYVLGVLLACGGLYLIITR